MENVGPPPAQTSGSGSFLTPLLISMGGIVASSLALVICHLMLVRYCVRSRQRSTAASSAAETLRNFQFSNGIEEKILITIPILSYSTNESNAFRVDQSECVVCLGELQEGEMVRLLPNCRHAFHVTCIDNWFLGHSNCPVCRSPIVEPTTPDDHVALCVDDERNEELQRQVCESAGDTGASASCSESSGNNYLVRHSISLAVPMEGKRQRLAKQLTRSLSMDQYYVLVNIQSQTRKEESSSLSSSKRGSIDSRLSRVRSLRQLDWMSSRLARSFSQIRIGRSNSSTVYNLPF